MAETHRLQFSLGPVQGFVAQSRRTRDLWSSSFLLSHLATIALDEAAKSAKRVVMPAWDHSTRESTLKHDFGTVPNRFVIDFESPDSARTAAVAARQALLSAWQDVARFVWDEFVAPVTSHGHNTRSIWERQVANFWEISWVIELTDRSAQGLAARKNWRTTPSSVEPGDHCTMMSERQELSGWIRSQQRTKQDEFWMALRGRVDTLDLAEDERLCAIAIIKRLFPVKNYFPNVAEQTFGRQLDRTRWPSTAYVAAIPWLIAAAECDKTQELAKLYGQQIGQLARNSLGERQSKIPKLRELKKTELTGDFLSLDGNFFQRAAISNPRVTPLQKQPDEKDEQSTRSELQKMLDNLSKQVGSKPSAFYALLLMDGDSMGAMLGTARASDPVNGESRASLALSEFSRRVPEVVGEHDFNGVTLYAGGDDVMAMLPLESALKCAIRLTETYQAAFKTQFDRDGDAITQQATISGAIVYAHYHTPLRDVLQTAHHLLDDVAKDATGRNSLAVAVFKSSGITAQWSAPWEHIRTNESSNIIDDLLNDLGQGNRSHAQSADNGRSAEFSSGFLYNVRERFAALTDSALLKPGEFGELSDGLRQNDLLNKVLEADYLRGLSHRGDEDVAQQNRQKAALAIERLLKLCQRVKRRRVEGSDPPQFELQRDASTLGIDGALLVRFLANDGKEDAE